MVDRVGAQDPPLEPGAEVVVAGRLLAVGPEHAPRPARLGQVDQPVGALRLQHHLHPALLDLGAAAVAADGAHQRQRLHELALHAVGLRVPHDRRVGVERRPPIDLVVGVGIGGAGQPVDRARGHVLQVDRVGHRRPVAAAGVVGRPHVGDLPVVPADRRGSSDDGTGDLLCHSEVILDGAAAGTARRTSTNDVKRKKARGGGALKVELSAPNPFYVPLDRELTRSLDGTWRFAPDPDDRGETEAWHRAGVQGRLCPVPAAWQFVFDDLRDYRGPVWYERELTVSSEYAGRRVARGLRRCRLPRHGVGERPTRRHPRGRLSAVRGGRYRTWSPSTGPTGSRSGRRCRRINWRFRGTRPPARIGAASGGRCGWK